jgi:hypothetical protein
VIVAVLFVLGTAAICVALPLFVYGLSLALFGLPHVLAELRYVFFRFGGRWPRNAVIVVGSLLTAIVVLRIMQLGGLLTTSRWLPIELILVAALAAMVLPALWRRGVGRAVVGGTLVVGVGLGAAYAPIATALALAILHNFTPVGFFAEGLRGADRRKALQWSAWVFIAVPLVILSGLPSEVFRSFSLHAAEASWLPTGPLADHIKVYVPATLESGAWAVPLFSAMVFAQCMHYAAVIHVLPRMGETPQGTSPLLSVGLAVIGLAMLGAFSQDFSFSRSAYGIAAAVHAWVEVPVLLAALLGAGPDLKAAPG